MIGVCAPRLSVDIDCLQQYCSFHVSYIADFRATCTVPMPFMGWEKEGVAIQN